MKYITYACLAHKNIIKTKIKKKDKTNFEAKEIHGDTKRKGNQKD